MSKKIISTLLALMLALGVCLAFAGCGEEEPEETVCTTHVDNDGDGVCDTEGCDEAVTPSPTPTPDTGYFNENGELLLYKNGAPTYQIVLGNDVNALATDVADLLDVLNGLSTSDAKSVNYGDPAEDVEILIGTVPNRGEEYVFDKYDLGERGYMVKQVGTKIVVLGGGATGLENAIKYLKETVFGIKKNNNAFTDFAMAAAKNYEYVQTGYTVSEVTIAGASIEDYALVYENGNTAAKSAAEDFQKKLYSDAGLRVEVYRADRYTGDASLIKLISVTNDGEGNGFDVYFEDGDLVICCEYKGLYEDIVAEYFDTEIFSKKNKATFASDYSYTYNYRDIYYADFGAKGDGTTDDFFAIKEAHDYANEHLMRVHADPEATYYIGNANGSTSISVKTNTYWHGCEFIFDDEGVRYDDYNARNAPIFCVESDVARTSYYADTAPITSLASGATNVGWQPGKDVLVVLRDSNTKRYIRYGLNEDSGNAQTELLLVHADGTIDPTTPVQWDYTAFTAIYVYSASDRAVGIYGEGENGERTVITTLYNDAPSDYTYYSRNIQITRSNFTLSGVEHIYDSYTLMTDGGEGAPYDGFTQVENAHNVVIENMIFERPPSYNVVEIDPATGDKIVTSNNMGSYEINANLANNVTWRNCVQSNFYNEDGSVTFHGYMGTNECKNLFFDNMFGCSFDAHRGVYNATIRNTTIEHINFVGAGLGRLENVTLYADGSQHAAINHREDYGSPWWGDLEIDGLYIKYESGASYSNQISLIKATHTNWDFGYRTSYAQNISVRNVVMVAYTYSVSNGVRTETIVGYNRNAVRLYSSSMDSPDGYASDTVKGQTNINKMITCKNVTIDTVYTGEYAELGLTSFVDIVLPDNPDFENTKFVIDGVAYSYDDAPNHI